MPLSDRIQFETLLSDISAQLIAVGSDRLGETVQSALAAVGRFFRADRCALLAVSDNLQTVRVAHAAYADGIPHVSAEVNLALLFPWLWQRLVVDREPVAVPRWADAPPEAAVDRASAEAMPTRSTLVIPIEAGPERLHLILINTAREERVWPEEYVPRLRLLGEVLVNALERGRAFAELQASEERLERAAASARCGLWELDTRTGEMWVTPETRRIYGVSPEETTTYSRFIDLIHEHDREAVMAAIATAVADRSRYDQLYRIVRGDGAVRWVHATGRAGDANVLLGVSVDVTDLVEVSDRAREQAARLAAAVDAAELGFAEWTPGTERPYLDSRSCDLLGIGVEETAKAQELWVARMHAESRPAVAETRRRLLAGEAERASVEYRYDHPRRGLIWLRHSSRRVEGEPGQRARTIEAIEDVTEYKQALEDLQRLRERLERENVYLRQEANRRLGPQRIVGRGPAIRRTLALAEQVAATDSTVLLLGETGSGKDRLASYIHDCSRRRDRPMILVNCSAIPTPLMESELFGREKGAYTGALSKQVGRFELAHGSTLFIDEIGELPVEVQVKLLRVLENRTIERLGNPKPITVDVRIIAATHRDLAGAVREGRFREDLYYRLNVFPISVPPLRERREDIPLFIQAFVEELSGAMGKHVEEIDSASVESLVAYAWPGNVRELRNVVERAMILATGPTLRIDLPQIDTSEAASRTDVSDAERTQILQVLQETGWRVRGAHGAAARLGLKPTTLESRIKKLGLTRPGTRALLPWMVGNLAAWTTLVETIRSAV